MMNKIALKALKVFLLILLLHFMFKEIFNKPQTPPYEEFNLKPDREVQKNSLVDLSDPFQSYSPADVHSCINISYKQFSSGSFTCLGDPSKNNVAW